MATSSATPAIAAQGLVKRFPAAPGWRDLVRLWPGRRDAQGTLALDGVDVLVRRGEVFGLVGPNGAGKTTLIKILCTLILPSAGSAQVNGYGLEQAERIKASVGLAAGDERSFYWRLSGRENLVFFGRLHGLGRRKASERAGDLLRLLGLSEAADRRFQTYSAGMKQRLAIARGLIHEPSILFMDEPSRSLDPTATQELHALIAQKLVAERRTTVFLTTHRLDEAAALCNRIAVLMQGRIRACGTLAELRALLPSGQCYEVVVRGLPGEQGGLSSRLSAQGIQVQAGTDLRLTFTALDGDDKLQSVLREVWLGGGKVEAVYNRPVTLEEVFSFVTHADDGRHAKQMPGLSGTGPAH